VKKETRVNINEITLAALLTLGGCYGPADYLPSPQAAISHGSGAAPIDAEQLKVDSKQFPRFRVKHDVKPPANDIRIDMVEIRDSDIWEVAYRLNDFYMIVSSSYNDRQCRFLNSAGHKSIAGISQFTGSCNSQYFYTIYVDLAGHVTGGWQIVFNPHRVISSAERRLFLTPDPKSVQSWGPQPLFRKIEK
jgi:hypothetical protein